MNNADATKILRAQYIANRKAVLTRGVKKMTSEDFDAAVARNIPRNPTPQDWVIGSQVMYNMNTPCSRCNQTRCPDGCCCGC